MRDIEPSSPVLPANAFIVLTDRQIKTRSIYRRLVFEPARELDREFGGRRSWINQLGRVLLNADRCFWPDGAPYEPPFIDDVFEEDNRWMSYFLSADETGAPRRYCRKFERLRMIALLCRMMAEERSRLFLPTVSRNAPGTAS